MSGDLDSSRAIGAVAKAAVPERDCPDAADVISEAMRRPPLYRHIVNSSHFINYVYNTPFFRVESRDGVGLDIVRKGIADSEWDRNISHVYTDKSELEVSRIDFQSNMVPVRREDVKNCFVRALLKVGAFVPALETSESSLADMIHAVEPQGPSRVDYEAAAMDVSVGIGSYKKIEETGSIGTKGLGPCVGLSVYSPASKRAAVAHVDPSQNPTELTEDVLSLFLGEDSSQLTAQLVGGWGGASERTVYYIRQALERHGVPITYQDILWVTKGFGFAVDAGTGKLRELPPGTY